MESYVKFIISCGSEKKKGIHIRNAIENRVSFHYVTVEPVFLNHEYVGKFLIQLLNIPTVDIEK